MGRLRAPYVTALLIAAMSAVGLVSACGAKEHPPAPLWGPDPDTGTRVDSGPDPIFDTRSDSDINCSADAGGVCSCKEIGQRPTSLYLVLDRSGSMSAPVLPGTLSAWNVVRRALLAPTDGVLRKLGSRISIGAARFPGPGATSDSPCVAGTELFKSRLGGPTAYDVLFSTLEAEIPTGGTPTAATLKALAPTLKALPSPAFVLLATDGGPNCGNTPCAIDRCIPNLEHATFPGGACDDTTNCCDPTKPPFGTYRSCLDTENTKNAVLDLVASGVKVFVLGVPNDVIDTYTSELDALAVAGGMPQEGTTTKYYSARDAAELTTALSAIAAKVIDSCVIPLTSPVDDPGITNVLLDGDLIPQDPVDGWSWTDGTHAAVRLNGKSCARVSAGGVANVKVAVGCKTITK